jgi:RNA polymerase sigma-70 factor, ECF subfamily
MDDERHERFRALYVSTRPRILAFALRRAPSPQDAADVVADTFAVAWRRLDDVPEGTDALLWLYVTARHVLANEARRAQRRTNLVQRIGSVLAERQTLVPPTDEAGLVAVVALRALDEQDREVLMLTGWEGLDAAETGHVLGCSAGAVRVRLHRARRRLVQKIAELSGEGPTEKPPATTGHTETEGAAMGYAHEED